MSRWIIDPDHSVAAFAVRHMLVCDVHGQFNRLSGTIDYDPADPAATSMEAAIDATGVCTGVAKRDEHLRSEEFFFVEKHPSLSFKSTGVEITGSNLARVTGNLTMRGVTRPLILDVEYFGPVASPFDDTVLGVRLEGRLDREDFGLMWNVPMDMGGLLASREVRLTVNVEADLEKGLD